MSPADRIESEKTEPVAMDIDRVRPVETPGLVEQDNLRQSGSTESSGQEPLKDRAVVCERRPYVIWLFEEYLPRRRPTAAAPCNDREVTGIAPV